MREKERKYEVEQGERRDMTALEMSVEVERTFSEKEGRYWQPKTAKKMPKVDSRRWGAYCDKTATFIAAWGMDDVSARTTTNITNRS